VDDVDTRQVSRQRLAFATTHGWRNDRFGFTWRGSRVDQLFSLVEHGQLW